MNKKIEILKQNGYYFLWENKKMWMWDIPIERKIQSKIAKKAFGGVLIVGYGLGLVHRYLKKNKKVNYILTIEKNKKVIDSCKKTFGKLYGDVIISDFFKFKTKKKFDCIIGDTWDEIDEESLPEYKKFKRTAQKFLKPKGKILAWGKDYFEYLIKK